ncbi:MAG: hypothetical protein ACODAU_00110 [Myxococcota bacterium]
MTAGAPGTVESAGAREAGRPRPGPRLLADDPAKRSVERIWLWYTPVWGLAAGVVMIGGFANHWGDVELTSFAVALALGALVPPVVLRPAEDREGPWYRSTAAKMGLSVTGFALLINYSHSPFFFDVLHMHYGFDTTWNVRQTPIGLYLMTVAYFATYSVLCMAAYRGVRHAVRGVRASLRWPAVAVAPFGVAFLETALNANPFMGHLFCYDDMAFALSFGTLAYGTAFCFALPAWLAIDERPGRRVGFLVVVVGVLAAVYAEMLVLDVLRHHVAPLFTVVEHGADGFRDFDTSCLEPLPGSK